MRRIDKKQIITRIRNMEKVGNNWRDRGYKRKERKKENNANKGQDSLT